MNGNIIFSIVNGLKQEIFLQGYIQIPFKILGRKVLERRASDEGNNDTYFVYNDLGQLRFVLSPEYQNDRHKAIFAYEYRYDNRGNVVKKILPQCEYIQYWYDTADRLIYMQDGRMRTKGLYRFYLYDNLSRIVVEGTCSSCNRGGSVTHTKFNASNAGFLNTGYTFDHNLNLGNPKLEVVNYYDDYSFLNLPLFKNDKALKKATNTSNQTCAKGYVTGTITATNNGDLLLSTLYYDLKGELTESHRTLPDNALLVTKNTYSFTRNPDTTKQTLYKGGKEYTVSTNNGYNPFNDKIESTSLSVDGSANREISTITYDDLGRISNISHGSNNVGAILYSYNLRGWITEITNNNFEEHLTYNDGQGTPYYNGNISTQQWKVANDDSRIRGYKFMYDKLNRLTNAVYGEGTSFNSNQGRYSEIITGYTANGAIEGIIRNGLTQKGAYAAIDSLDITHNGNQLSRVDDKAAPVLRSGSFDFYDNKVKTDGAEYEYDENGALTMDANRGITKIEYDLRNNPTLIQFSDGSQTEYVYTASGEKLKTIHHKSSPFIHVRLQSVMRRDTIGQVFPPIDGTSEPVTIMSVDSTDYIENFIFENGKPDKYLFDGGYYTFATPKTGYSRYHYFITDHLGNNRVVINENDSMEQVTHYYPFGAVYADAGLNPNLQKLKYNGKELDLMHGLNSYDYGARQYYAAVPTWDRMDPLCEKYYSISPYAYCFDSPISFVDPDGRDGVRVIDYEHKTITIKADYYVVTGSIFYLNKYGEKEELKGYSPKDIEEMNDYNKYLNELKLKVPSGEYKDYTISFDLHFEGADNIANARIKADDDNYQGYSIGNTMQLGNKDVNRNVNFGITYNEDGTTSTVGGVTDKNKYILMNEPEDSKMNRIHEIFHTFGFSHPKGSGGKQGIMKYPPSKPSKKDALEGQLQKSVDALGGGLTKIYCQVVYEERNKVCTFAT